MEKTTSADVAIIGGGPAGLTAAIALARFGRRIVMIDEGRPRNAPARAMHNVLGLDGLSPTEYLARGRAEFARYGGVVVPDTAVSGRRSGPGFEIDTTGCGPVLAPRLLVAGGVRDELPDLPGLAELWGGDVVHCPFCHGWEVRGRSVGVLGTGPASAHQAAMFAELSDDVVFFDQTGPEAVGADPDVVQRLSAIGVRFVPEPVVGLETVDGRLVAAVVSDGTRHPIQALVVTPRPSAQSAVLDALGVPRGEAPFGYQADAFGATPVDGVWIAGNVANANTPVVVSAASGMTAAGAITADIVAARARSALAVEGGPGRSQPSQATGS